MDKFASLNAFIHVVEHGSFAAAARALGTSRAQVNRQVINLEDALGAQLLHRITLRISARKEQAALIAHEIIEARRVLCAAPAFLGQHGTPQHPRELADLPCLHYGNLPTGNTWRLDKNGESIDIRVHGPFCANNADVLCEAAGAGLGIALLPLFIAHDALRAGTLVTVLDDYHAPRIYLSLVYAPSRNMSRKIRLFVKFMQQWFTLSDF